jgi:hypothetical protein
MRSEISFDDGPITGFTKPHTYETITVLGKSFSPGGDTVIYRVKRDTYIPKKCESCTAFNSTDTTVNKYTNLDMPAVHNNYTICYGIADTMYVKWGKKVWEKHPTPKDSCFEADAETTYFMEGVGGPFYTRMELSGPWKAELLLSYFKKTDGSTSGFREGDKPKRNLAFSFSVFPNPAENSIAIQSSEKYKTVSITDMTGRVLISSDSYCRSIDVSTLEQGMYLINLCTSDYKVYTEKVVKR